MENLILLPPLKRFFKLLELDKKSILYIYLYALLAGFITLSLPLGIQAIIGLIAGGNMSASLVLLVVAVTLGSMLSGIMRIMQISITENIQRKIFARSALDFAYRIPKLNMDALSEAYPPELVNRFFDTLTLQKGIPKILIDISTAVLQIAFGLLLITFYHSFFAFFGLVLLVLLIAIFWFTGSIGLRTSLQESKYKYKVAYWLEDMARTIPAFKLFGRAPLAMEKTDDLVCSYLTSRQKHFRILLIQYGNLVALKTIMTGSLLLLGSYLVIQNQINIGQFVAAEIVVILVIASVEKLILSMETIYDVLTGLEKLGYVMDLPLESDKGLPFKEIDNGKGLKVDVKDLFYQFEDATQPTVDNVSLNLEPGQKVNIAGYNGAGKSTLLELLLGQFEKFNGNILYNGFPLRTLDLIDLRSNIGHFGTETAIFHGTIMDNITLGRKNVGLREALKAAQMVGLSDYVEHMPKGYDTQVITEGRNIPGNIKTKIRLARCVAGNPKMILVEAGLQNLERSMYENVIDVLTNPNASWTLVIISNDPFVAERCDEVIIMDKGKIVDKGAFEDIQQSPHFSPIFTTSISRILNRLKGPTTVQNKE
jgi:ABC-type bacteriocin/lantibiotic exporter with double-glycine peptidase domain